MTLSLPDALLRLVRQHHHLIEFAARWLALAPCRRHHLRRLPLVLGRPFRHQLPRGDRPQASCKKPVMVEPETQPPDALLPPPRPSSPIVSTTPRPLPPLPRPVLPGIPTLTPLPTGVQLLAAAPRTAPNFMEQFAEMCAEVCAPLPWPSLSFAEQFALSCKALQSLPPPFPVRRPAPVVLPPVAPLLAPPPTLVAPLPAATLPPVAARRRPRLISRRNPAQQPPAPAPVPAPAPQPLPAPHLAPVPAPAPPTPTPAPQAAPLPPAQQQAASAPPPPPTTLPAAAPTPVPRPRVSAFALLMNEARQG